MVEVRRRSLPRHGTDHILNRCPGFRGFVYQHAYFSADKKSIEVAVRPRLSDRPRRYAPALGGKERTIGSFQGFFTMIGDEVGSKIVFVCSDMWEPYLKVIREKCSEALHILDRFHIVAKMNKALDEVRAGESRRMAMEGRTPVLKKSRWLLLKREENLKTEQRFRLRDLLRYNLGTVRAYLLKEAFQQLWDYNSAAWDGKFLDEWCRQVMRSRIEPMKKIARSLRQHRELILNYFRAQKLLSSGVVEGLNNKAKVTMRKSYGFRTFRCLELALYHSLGKLPEPRSTHDFF
jgi:transposase